MSTPPTPKNINDFVRALQRGDVKSLQGARLEAGGWHYTARYDEGPDALYPKPHPVPPSWVQAGVRSGLVRPLTVDVLQTARVMDFLIPNAETRRPMPRWAEEARQRKTAPPAETGEAGQGKLAL